MIQDVFFEVKLSRGYFAKVEKEDYELICNIKWHLIKTKKANAVYAYHKFGKKNISMHRFIYEHHFGPIPSGMIIDHKDGDGLNNVKSNLRVCTYSENCANVGKKRKNPTSKYKGVFFEKSCNRWRAKIKKQHKDIHIGVYKTEIEAASAYNSVAKEIYGEFAFLNSI